MCAIDLCDDPPKFHESSHRKARKEHRCDECRRVIAKDERYEYVFLVDYDGNPGEQRTCAHCEAARSWLRVTCGGWMYEGVRDDLQEHFGEGSAYRSVWLARAIVGMRRKWTQRDGALMPVPTQWEGE